MPTKITLILAPLVLAGALLASGDTTASAADRASKREAKLERRVDRVERRANRLARQLRRSRAQALAANSALAAVTGERDQLV